MKAVTSRRRALRSDERGDFTGATLVMMVAVLMAVSFTVDAGRLLTARREVNDTAAQAARAAAQVVDGNSLAAGEPPRLAPDAADAAQGYLELVDGVEGTAVLVGDHVEVDTTAVWSPLLFDGFVELELHGRAIARAARGVTAADNNED